jgi:type I restriction enzyme S subunit
MKFEKIGNVFLVIRNGANIKQDKVTDGYPITRIETIADGTVDLNRVGYASIHDESFSEFYLQENDILMSHINSVSHLGKVALVNQIYEKVIHGMNLLCLKADVSIINPMYSFYYFKSPIFRSKIKRITKKSVNQASFNISNLKDIEIPLPPLPDQLHIANLLSKAENLIAQRKESIRLLDEFLKSTFLEMFGDPGTNPLKWNLVKLESSFLVKPLIGSMVPAVETGNIPIVRVGEIGQKKINFEKCKFSQLNTNDIEKYRLVNGDILLARAIGSESHLGKASIFYDNNKTVVYDSHVMRLRFHSKIINPEYFYTFLQTQGGRKRFMRKAGQTSIQFNINSKQISDIDIPVPPIELQTQFAQIVEKTEALKTQYQKNLQELENLYGSLSQKAFRGELSINKAVSV